ncbi:WXG100 family type VII secretion target [Actinoplanes sp. NPDC051851]|uniref:WXG100 family type VII secretion target n=1 Tax=Actinoplanes sp. NPDC051851 TaxID=3154753 RepID=UPI003417F6A7
MSETVVGGVTYHVTLDVVNTAAASTRTTASEMAEIIADLRSYVVSLEEIWAGVASEQFQMLMSDYDTFARMLQNALDGIASGLEGTYLNYRDTEIANLNELEVVDLGTPPALFD